MKQTKWIGASLLATLLVLATLVAPVWAQVPVTHMRNVAIQVLRVTAGLTTDDLTVSDDAVVSDALTVIGNSLLTGDASFDADLVILPAAVITVTNGATLTPGGSYQPIASAGTVGFGAITIAAAGTKLTVVNTVNQTITITDAGTLKLSGNAALGQYDAIQLLSDGTNWIQIAPESDN